MAEDKKKPTSTKKKKINPEKFVELNPTLEEDSSETDSLDERAPLTIQQRRARGRTMRRLKTRMQAARKRSARKKASTEKLKARARKKARGIIRDRLSAGKKYSEMSPSEKVQLDKRLHRIPDATISRIATRQLPQVRRAEMDRLARMRGGSKTESIDFAFTNFLFERRICPPKKPHMAMTKEGKVKFDRRFKFFRKEAQTELDESFIGEAAELMNTVELYMSEQTAMERTREQIRREKESAKARHERMKDSARRTDQNQRNESVDPNNREQGTDSLVKIYKKDTPGQKKESYFASEIPNSFGDFRKGSRVTFSSHSMDMADDGTEKEGTVVGSTVQYLRVRDDDSILYRVRHQDAELVGE